MGGGRGALELLSSSGNVADVNPEGTCTAACCAVVTEADPRFQYANLYENGMVVSALAKLAGALISTVMSLVASPVTAIYRASLSVGEMVTALLLGAISGCLSLKFNVPVVPPPLTLKVISEVV